MKSPWLLLCLGSLALLLVTLGFMWLGRKIDPTRKDTTK